MNDWADIISTALIQTLIALCIFGAICFLRDACKKLREVWKQYRRLHG